jgi:hypothetical protein
MTNTSSTVYLSSSSLDARFSVTEESFFEGGTLTVIDFNKSAFFAARGGDKYIAKDKIWFYLYLWLEISVDVKAGTTGHDIMAPSIYIVFSESRDKYGKPLFDTTTQANFINARIGMKTESVMGKKEISRNGKIENIITVQPISSSISLLDNNSIMNPGMYISNVFAHSSNQAVDDGTFEIQVDEEVPSFTFIDIITTTSAAFSFILFLYSVLLGDKRISPHGVIQEHIFSDENKKYSSNISEEGKTTVLETYYLKDYSKHN